MRRYDYNLHIYFLGFQGFESYNNYIFSKIERSSFYTLEERIRMLIEEMYNE